MSRLLAAAGSLLSYLAIGTVVSQIALFGYLYHTGMISQTKAIHMLAVAYDVRVNDERDEELVAAEQSSEQASLRDMREQSAVVSRNLELRRAMLTNNKEEMLRLVRNMKDQMEHYQNITDAFEDRLTVLQAGGTTEAREEVRLILENAKPKQAKEQLVIMLDNGEMRDVVMLLSAMPDGKRKNIITEFKTDEEEKKLAEILREIRKGGPETDLIESTRERLQP